MPTEFFIETLAPNLAGVGAVITDLAGTELVARTAATEVTDYVQKVSVTLPSGTSDGYVWWDDGAELIAAPERFSTLTAIVAKTALIGSTNATVPVAITQNGRRVEIVVGADYVEDDGTNLTWELASSVIEVNKADIATIELVVPALGWNIEGSKSDVTDGIVFSVELTRTGHTADRTIKSSYPYYIKATLSDGSVLPTLARGTIVFVEGEGEIA